MPLLSVEVNNQQQAGPKCSYDESVTTMGINNQRVSPALESINEFADQGAVVLNAKNGDDQSKL